jgi:outer membrane protein TolC
MPVPVLGHAPMATLTLTFNQALDRARANSQQLLSADIAARIAHEDRVQAKAALLPSLTWLNGYVYTQQNGPLNADLIFIANDGPNMITNMANVHSDLFSPAKRADYRVSIAAEAVARAKVDIAARGLVATVFQNFYGMAVTQRHLRNAQLSLQDALQLADITRKQEAGGEAAHADVVKAEITLHQRERDLQDAQLAADKARIGFAVFLFPDFRQDFGVADDLDTPPPLPPFPEVETMALNNNPDIRAAQAAITQGSFGVRSARAGYLPVLSVDYYYGIQAREYALHNEFGQKNLGSSVMANLNVPVWNWGATHSKVKQAELKLQQAHTDLSFSQRQLLANLNSFYLEASTASSQLASLKRSLDLSDESLRLTVLRYQAGEATVLEVVDAQTTLAGARNAYDDGLARYRVALANIQTLTGAF